VLSSIWGPWAASNPRVRVGSRRWFLQAGLAGLGALTVPNRVLAAATAGRARKSVILFWLSGGPSHIDMWDPKPSASLEIRGPYASIATRIPGVRFGEHLPLQAAMADQLTIIRSVDCSASDHTPITMQAGNPLARRTNDGRDGDGYPSMGSVAARFHGANAAHLPPFVGLADDWVSDVWEAGELGRAYAPVNGGQLAGKFTPPPGMTVDRLRDRDGLRRQFDHLGRSLDSQATTAMTRHAQQAYDMLLSGAVRDAFDVQSEPEAVREAYGRTSIGEKALLARRLVEAGVGFVLVSGAWGYFDHHGDNVRWGGIEKGLTPLLPSVDRVLPALVQDLRQRGLLDETLVMMMGEFGRAPRINADAGRDHWTPVMSMAMAGGGLRHGQVIGATDAQGGAIVSQPVRPQDLAATTFRHLGIDLDAHWIDHRGRPRPIVAEGGRPIPELF
jgi:Protein of unknown function (DUF1501)